MSEGARERRVHQRSPPQEGHTMGGVRGQARTRECGRGRTIGGGSEHM